MSEPKKSIIDQMIEAQRTETNEEVLRQLAAENAELRAKVENVKLQPTHNEALLENAELQSECKQLRARAEQAEANVEQLHELLEDLNYWQFKDNPALRQRIERIICETVNVKGLK